MRYYNLNSDQMGVILSTAINDGTRAALDLAARCHAAQALSPGDIVRSTRSGDTYVIVDDTNAKRVPYGTVAAKRVAGFDQPIGGFVRFNGKRLVEGTMELVGTLNDNDSCYYCGRDAE